MRIEVGVNYVALCKFCQGETLHFILHRGQYIEDGLPFAECQACGHADYRGPQVFKKLPENV